MWELTELQEMPREQAEYFVWWWTLYHHEYILREHFATMSPPRKWGAHMASGTQSLRVAFEK